MRSKISSDPFPRKNWLNLQVPVEGLLARMAFGANRTTPCHPTFSAFGFVACATLEKAKDSSRGK